MNTYMKTNNLCWLILLVISVAPFLSTAQTPITTATCKEQWATVAGGTQALIYLGAKWVSVSFAPWDTKDCTVSAGVPVGQVGCEWGADSGEDGSPPLTAQECMNAMVWHVQSAVEDGQ